MSITAVAKSCGWRGGATSSESAGQRTRSLEIGQKPEASFRFELGQCTTFVPVEATKATSASVSCVMCAATQERTVLDHLAQEKLESRPVVRLHDIVLVHERCRTE